MPSPATRRMLARVALTLALLSMPSLLRADEGARENTGGDPSLTQRAEALLAETGSASRAAIEWLSEHVSPGVVARVAEDAQSVAQRQWEELVDAARERSERELGTFLYTPRDDGNAWTPIDEVSADSTPVRIVLLVHGLDEPGDIWTDLAPALHDEHHVVARFNYPNDQDPTDSADALADALRALEREVAADRVDLVCHSMGGLIARDVLTRPSLYGADGSGDESLPAIPRLITIGTPNHGSALAPLRALGEVREHLARWLDSGATDHRALLGFLYDGDGAAADALAPGSEYLEALNDRPLPEHTRITVIIGRASPVNAEDVREMLDQSWAQRVLGDERVERLRRQTEEIVGTVGDGVVTVESARLEGVEDTVILDANHRSLVRRIPLADKAREVLGDEPRDPPAIEIILDRLSESEE